MAIFSLGNLTVDRSCLALHNLALVSRGVMLRTLPVLQYVRSRKSRNATDKGCMTEADLDSWEAGDVYRDFELLEQGIRLANADVNLQEMERLDLLTHMAGSRRSLIPDVQRYLFLPLLATGIFRRFPTPVATILFHLSNFHFWVITVVVPITLLVAKRITKPPPTPMPIELKGLPIEYLSLSTATDWERPETSCQDAVLVILEYMTSAVSIMAVFGTLRAVVSSALVTHISKWMAVIQLVTRLAVVGAIHQNPEQLYRIRRQTQPRPLPLFTCIMQQAVSSIIFFLPLGFTMDLYVVLGNMSSDAVTAFYSIAFVGIVGTWLRLLEEQRRDANDDRIPQLQGLKTRMRWLYGIAALVIARAPLRGIFKRHGWTGSVLVEALQQPFQSAWPLVGRLFWTALLWTLVVTSTLTVPLLHLKAVAKQVRVVYTHDASLAMSPTDFEKVTHDESRKTWRYRLEWQEKPQRIGQALNKWRSNLAYWLFLEGRTQDQLVQEQQVQREKSHNSADWSLLDRLSRGAGYGRSFVPQNEWKQNAMSRVADQHQTDYDRKSFEDPLGVAVQQTFGIGLGFNYDHDQPLKKGEQPSLRRLQARAAKSAIRRAQQLYDPQRAKNELDNIVNTEERNARAAEMRKSAEEEMNFLAKRLSELVPPPSEKSIEFKDRTAVKRFQQRRQPSGWIRVNSHEYRPLFDDPEDAVNSVEQDIMNFESQSEANLMESDVHTRLDDKDQDVANVDVNDDEFVEAFVRQQANLSNLDEDDDYTQITLT